MHPVICPLAVSRRDNALEVAPAKQALAAHFKQILPPGHIYKCTLTGYKPGFEPVKLWEPCRDSRAADHLQPWRESPCDEHTLQH
jgi:hypothetical protein